MDYLENQTKTRIILCGGGVQMKRQVEINLRKELILGTGAVTFVGRIYKVI